MWRRSTLGKLLRVKKRASPFLPHFHFGLLNNTGNATGWKLLSGLWHNNWHCFCFVATQRQIETFLRTFANFWQQEEEEERRRTKSRIFPLNLPHGKGKNFCAPFKKGGRRGNKGGDRLQPPPPPARALFRKSKWVNIQVGRREEEPLVKARFFCFTLWTIYNENAKKTACILQIRIRNIKRTVLVFPPPKKIRRRLIFIILPLTNCFSWARGVPTPGRPEPTIVRLFDKSELN